MLIIDDDYYCDGVNLWSTGGASAAAAASSTDEDPVSEVMSRLIKDFKDVTHCNDDEECRKYIEMAQMDLNRAIELYIDTMSWWPTIW